MSETVKGNVVDPDSKVLANCQLFMFRRTDGALLGSAVSDQNGDYELTHTAQDGEKVFLVCLDNDDAPDFEGIVRDRITIQNNSSASSYENATDTAVLTGFNPYGSGFSWATAPTVDVYVNDILVESNVPADCYINQQWNSNQALSDNSAQSRYMVYGDSSLSNYFYSRSLSYIKFEFVPNQDGSLTNDEVCLAKDALTISNSNSNPTVYKDPTTGVITFYLAPNPSANM